MARLHISAIPEAAEVDSQTLAKGLTVYVEFSVLFVLSYFALTQFL